MSNGAILMALKRMGYRGRMTGHGFRGVASTALNEMGYRWDDRGAVVRMWRATRPGPRTTMRNPDERREMMVGWANYLDAVRQTGRSFRKGRGRRRRRERGHRPAGAIGTAESAELRVPAPTGRRARPGAGPRPVRDPGGAGTTAEELRKSSLSLCPPGSRPPLRPRPQPSPWVLRLPPENSREEAFALAPAAARGDDGRARSRATASRQAARC